MRVGVHTTYWGGMRDFVDEKEGEKSVYFEGRDSQTLYRCISTGYAFESR